MNKTQTSKKYHMLDEEKLLKKQQETEKKYGLRPHKRLRVEYLYPLDDIDSGEPQNLIEFGGMYQ